MPRQRNYKAEYQRRMASAAKRGLSRSQARGHAKAGEASAPASSKALENALKLYRQTGNRAAAAKEHGIAPERFSRFLAHAVTVTGRGKTLKIEDDRLREMLVISNGEARPVILRGFEQASLNGEYLSAVNAFLNSNDIDLLRRFEGRSVIDAKGKAHPLETDANTLHEIAASGEQAFPEIYQMLGH